MKDLHSNISPVVSLIPAAIAATANGAAIDLQGFDSAEFIVNTGAIAAAGDYTVKVQHSSTTTSGDFTDCAAADLLGALPASLAADTVYRVGYKGGKRYVRHAITKNSGTSIIAGIVCLKGHPTNGPVA
ncbi:hypothetical protein [Brevundimonas sp. DC300-4]|uniref:hypothetical protein n=1 Tax=Brevundimonas sp. DC300-4 TaxID=2804594 RepID=UPI003CF15C88